jgi:hypothetical protein
MDILTNISKPGLINSAKQDDMIKSEIEAYLNSGEIEEVPMLVNSNSGIIEKRFRDKNTNVIFRYIEPNFPALGLWEKVDP